MTIGTATLLSVLRRYGAMMVYVLIAVAALAVAFVCVI